MAYIKRSTLRTHTLLSRVFKQYTHRPSFSHAPSATGGDEIANMNMCSDGRVA